MGSSYFGEPKLGNERASGSSSSSSRKGNKKSSSNSEKPKQPQRGLGVAQLEKIRLHGQIAYNHPSPPNYSLHPPFPSTTTFNNNIIEDPRMQMPYSTVPSSSSSSFSCSSSSTSFSPSYGFQSHNILMGLPENERTNIRYGDSQPTNTRWEHANAILENQSSAQSNITRPFLNLYDSQDIDIKKHRSGSLGSNSQNSESSDTQELDLELRLSL